MDIDESLQASSYASGFMSNVYPGRQVPDVCGLVGMRPGASYIMLPIKPGCSKDQSKAGGTHPPGDETDPNDGWAAFSGTSAAAPQLAGVAALIKQACARLTPSQVRNIMKKTARDVTQGNCNPNTGANPATQGPDDATGHGLVNAHKATIMAKLRCIGIGPIRSILRETQPRGPITTVPEPRRGPVTGPVSPIRSRAAELTDLELASLEPQLAQQPQLSEEDIEMLEKMLLESDFDITDK